MRTDPFERLQIAVGDDPTSLTPLEEVVAEAQRLALTGDKVAAHRLLLDSAQAVGDLGMPLIADHLLVMMREIRPDSQLEPEERAWVLDVVGLTALAQGLHAEAESAFDQMRIVGGRVPGGV